MHTLGLSGSALDSIAQTTSLTRLKKVMMQSVQNEARMDFGSAWFTATLPQQPLKLMALG